MSHGYFINLSGFSDQLSKKHDNDAASDVKAVLTRYNKDGDDVLGEPIETVIYDPPCEEYPTGEVYVRDVDDIIIQPGGRACINARIITKVPDNCYGKLASRSGLSKKYGIEIGAGIIDLSYRGLVSIMIYNHGFFPYVVKHGDRIAQLINEYINMERYEEVDSLEETDRNTAGFGSTGR